jgi:hypothetical protein
MPIRVDLLALEPGVPGQACLAVKKWTAGHERLEFSIQRKDGFYLQDHKHWSSQPFWFKVPHFSEGGESLETVIGAEVVDPVLEGSGSSNFQIELREQGRNEGERCVLRIGTGLLASSAGGETRGIYGATDLKTQPEALDIPNAPLLDLPDLAAGQPVSEPEPESISAEREPQPAVTPAPKKKSNALLMLIIALLLIIAAAAAYFLLIKKPQTPDPAAAPTPAPEVARPAPAAPGACALESMSTQAELAFVQACIKQAPASEQLLKIIETAKTSKHCGVAQRLYANRSQAGDVLIATAYAHEYDPKYHQASECFAEPDKATAAYWYETILGLQPDNAEAKQRFEELKP